MPATLKKKKCLQCHRSKPLGLFYKYNLSPDMLSYWCRDCIALAETQYVINTTDPQAAKWDKLYDKYRFTKYDYLERLQVQQCLCLICKCSGPQVNIVYCTVTGNKFFGIICKKCNHTRQVEEGRYKF